MKYNSFVFTIFFFSRVDDTCFHLLGSRQMCTKYFSISKLFVCMHLCVSTCMHLQYVCLFNNVKPYIHDYKNTYRSVDAAFNSRLRRNFLSQITTSHKLIYNKEKYFAKKVIGHPEPCMHRPWSLIIIFKTVLGRRGRTGYRLVRSWFEQSRREDSGFFPWSHGAQGDRRHCPANRRTLNRDQQRSSRQLDMCLFLNKQTFVILF